MSKSLLDLANAVKSCEEVYAKKIALFGPPGSGKTHIAATIAKVSSVSKVYWFDVENGIETAIYARTAEGNPLLTEKEMSKIIPFHIADTQEVPRAAETILKAFTSSKGVEICQAHGRVGCPTCSEKIPFNIYKLTDGDAIVIDSLSQVADSILNLSRLQNSYKDLRQHYGDFTIDMGAILSGIQATNANVIACTHELSITKPVEIAKGKIEERLLRVTPLCGSRNFSDKVGKFFGYKIYTYNNGSNFYATVKPGKISKVLVSSRRPVSFEGDTDPSLEKLFLSEEEAAKAEQSAKPAGLKPAIRIKSK